MESTYFLLVQACKLLTSEKASERKQQLQKITEFISEAKVIEILDKYSSEDDNQNNEKPVLTWDKLFILCKNYVIKELTLIVSSGNVTISSTQNSTLTQPTTTIVENKILQYRNLLNLVINQANSRGNFYLKATTFVSTLFQFFDELSSFKIIQDLSHHLYTNILNSYKYCCELTRNHWLQLIKIYTKVYLNPIDALDFTCCAKCIQIIIEKSCMFTSFHDTSKIFAFFQIAFEELSKDTNHDLIESLLVAMNCLCVAYQRECLIHIYKLCEGIFDKLMSILCSKHNDDIKILVVDFLLLQIKLRFNPKLSSQNEFYYKLIDYDSNEWFHENLKSIQRAIVDEIDEYCEKYKLSKNNSMIETSQVMNKYFEILAKCYVELNLTGNQIDRIEEQTPKRRRLNTSSRVEWELIYEESLDNNHLKTYSWINLFFLTYEKIPQEFISDKIDKILVILSQSNEILVLKIAFKALTCIINYHKPPLIDYIKLLNIIFNKNKFDQLKEFTYKMLTTIIKHKLIEKDLIKNHIEGLFYSIITNKKTQIDLYEYKFVIFMVKDGLSQNLKEKVIDWLFYDLDTYMNKINEFEINQDSMELTQSQVIFKKSYFRNQTQNAQYARPIYQSENDSTEINLNKNHVYRAILLVNLVKNSQLDFDTRATLLNLEYFMESSTKNESINEFEDTFEESKFKENKLNCNEEENELLKRQIIKKIQDLSCFLIEKHKRHLNIEFVYLFLDVFYMIHVMANKFQSNELENQQKNHLICLVDILTSTTRYSMRSNEAKIVDLILSNLFYIQKFIKIDWSSVNEKLNTILNFIFSDNKENFDENNVQIDKLKSKLCAFLTYIAYSDIIEQLNGEKNIDIKLKSIYLWFNDEVSSIDINLIVELLSKLDKNDVKLGEFYLELLNKMVIHLIKTKNSKYTQKIGQIFENYGLFDLVSLKTFDSIECHKQLIRLYSNIIHLKVVANDDYEKYLPRYYCYFTNQSSQLRVEFINSLKLLYQLEKVGIQFSKNIFDRVYLQIIKVIESLERPNDLSMSQFDFNKANSFKHIKFANSLVHLRLNIYLYFQNILINAPKYESKCLISFLHLLKIHQNLIINDNFKVVIEKIISNVFGLKKCVQDYLDDNLSDLIVNWLNLNYDINEFPYEFFGFGSLDIFLEATLPLYTSCNRFLIQSDTKFGECSVYLLINFVANEDYIERIIESFKYHDEFMLELPNYLLKKVISMINLNNLMDVQMKFTQSVFTTYQQLKFVNYLENYELFVANFVQKSNDLTLIQSFLAFVTNLLKNFHRFTLFAIKNSVIFDLNKTIDNLIDYIIDYCLCIVKNFISNNDKFDWLVCNFYWNILEFVNTYPGISSLKSKEYFTKIAYLIKEQSKLSNEFVQLKNFIYILNSNNYFKKEFPQLNLKTASISGFRKQLLSEIKNFISLYDSNQIQLIEYHLLFIHNTLIKLNGKDLLVIIENEIDGSILRRFFEIVLKICGSSKYQNYVKELCCKCIAVIGPINFKSDLNIENASLAYKQLVQIFQLPTTSTFLQEYDSIVQEFHRNNEEFSNQNKYFLEYSKTFRCKKKKAINMNINDINEESLSIFNRDDIWTPLNHTYQNWLTKFFIFLVNSGFCNDEIFTTSIEIFKNQLYICEQAIPYIVYKILNDSRTTTKRRLMASVVSQNIKKFFEKCYFDSKDIQIKCVKCMISILEFLREQFVKKENKCSFWEEPFWSNLNYLFISQSCQLCGYYFTSLYYLEIWFRETSNESQLKNESLVIELLIKAYEFIGQSDALSENFIYLNSLNPTDHIMRLNPQNLFEFDSKLFNSKYKSDTFFNLLQSLKINAFDFTLNDLLNHNNRSSESSQLIDLKYECAWKLGNWSLDLNDDFKHETLNKNIYFTLKTLKTTKSREILKFYADKTEKALLNELQTCDINLKCGLLRNIGHLYSLYKLKNSISFDDDYENCFDSSNFSVKDDILSLKIQILKDEYDSIKLFAIYDGLINNAVYNERFLVAKKYLNELRRVVSNENQLDINLKEIKLLIKSGELNRSRILLISGIDMLKMNDNQTELYIQYLNEYASVLDKMKSENPLVIIRDYLDKALSLIDKHKIENKSLITNTHFSLAKFADLQYKTITNYMKSSTFEQKAELMKKFQLEAEKVEKIEPNSRLYVMLRKQLNIDSHEIQSLNADREEYLIKAIKSYFVCLESTDDYDTHVSFRIISLWTENNQSSSINRLFESCYNRIATWKFLPLMYQLAARLSLVPDKFNQLLINLIYKTAENHPYHVLPILFAHLNAYKDDQLVNNDDDRLKAARFLIGNLKKHHLEIASSIETLFDAYIELANLSIDPKKNKSGSYQVPKKLISIKNCYIATKNIRISKNCDYSNIEKVVKFEPYFSLAGGVNLPKIITCIGTDGIKRRQLVKGKDDLRQDAIMQQMFKMVNDLFLQRARDFCMRCYNVIPLTKKSGVIEWCDGTMSLGDWLVEESNTGGAHKRYRPQDWLFSDCRKKLYDTHGNSVDKRTKLDVYLKICDNFKPVFRNFFIENYHTPYDWYTRRLKYTQSVACSSIVGYIIGLGDRHCQNILIDKRTAEVIHIDLGVAFDQGKILPIPETVPFRLTRDIVDGFGICGIEGVFTHSCELIMQLMMDSCEEIMTIFEVLIYDPLYNWSISPKKAYMLQPNESTVTCDMNSSSTASTNLSSLAISLDNGSNNDRNKIAERIIMSIRQKLLGYDNGFQLSCTGLVKSLIQEAMNPMNLSRIYAGWQPYL